MGAPNKIAHPITVFEYGANDWTPPKKYADSNFNQYRILF